MHEASQLLLGKQDFTSFRSVQCQSKSAVRTINDLQVARNGDLVIINISANAFLHHMVRNIAGVLIAVGSGRRPVSWVNEVLIAQDRKLGAETAPPYGLYLTGVVYPPEFGVSQTITGPMFLLGSL